MKQGETRIAYLARKAEEDRVWVRNRLEADERFLEQQLARVREEIARRQVNQTGNRK